MRPSARLKVGLRAALRRRYGYAALRVLRRALVAAVEAHSARLVGPQAYDGATEGDRLFRLYWEALQRLRRRWPGLDLDDERSRP